MTNQCSFPDTLHCFHTLFSRDEPPISSTYTICVSHQTVFRDTVVVLVDPDVGDCQHDK